MYRKNNINSICIGKMVSCVYSPYNKMTSVYIHLKYEEK